MPDKQLACVYAALLLDGSAELSAENLVKVTTAGKVPVTKGYAGAFAAVATKMSLRDIVGGLSFAGNAAPASAAAAAAAAPAAAAAAAPAAAPAAAAKEESDDDFGMGGLF